MYSSSVVKNARLKNWKNPGYKVCLILSFPSIKNGVGLGFFALASCWVMPFHDHIWHLHYVIVIVV